MSYGLFFVSAFLAMTMPITGSISIQTHTYFIQNLLKISSFIPFHDILTKKLKKWSNPMAICIRFSDVDSPSPFGFILHVIHDADCDDWSKFLHQMIPRDIRVFVIVADRDFCIDLVRFLGSLIHLM